MNQTPSAPQPTPNAALMLADGTVFWGIGFGADTFAIGEICFNTGMTGYQEVLTDPSYTGQIVTFTFPHIGNVGCNNDDIESAETPIRGAGGLVVHEPITAPSNFRSTEHLNDWLIKRKVSGISGVDTRALTHHIRKFGAQNAAIVRVQPHSLKETLLSTKAKLAAHPSLNGLDLAKPASTTSIYDWQSPRWSLVPKPAIELIYHVVAIDYGEKLNILRSLTSYGCRITVVPAETSADDIFDLDPDGVFLSNGPGDPAATGKYACATINALIDANVPVFGICLGHQILALALGATTEKMHQGHRGVNHPVKNLITGNVEITSQNHGFVVKEDSLPETVQVTHRSLFDGSVEGIWLKKRPVFSVQYHPESSPGPHDSLYLFEEFVKMMADGKDA